MDKKIGILGGMGPKATIYLFEQIVNFTRAERDSDHIPIIIFNNPKIPDRTEALINRGPSSLPLLIDGARLLEQAGASFILMPCVTAHYFYPEIIQSINIPFLHLIEETGQYLEEKMPGLKKIGLLATSGTVHTRIFQDHLEDRGKEIMVPDKKNQQRFMDAIYGQQGVKAGFTQQPKELILEVVSHLIEKGSQAVIAGCTEVPLALKPEDIPLPLINPLKILAHKAIEEAGYPVKSK